MNRPEEENLEAAQLTTVLNRLRPTVVVRRRVYEVARARAAVASPLATRSADAASVGFEDEDDESGPPSSVNVARALAALRVDELHRLEQILSAQDEDERVVAESSARQSAPAQPPVPTLRVGPVIALPELARRMAVSPQELVTALVTRGFFSVTFKSTLPRETARAAAWMFGWLVDDEDSDIAALAVAPKPTVKVKAKASTKPSAKKLTAKATAAKKLTTKSAAKAPPAAAKKKPAR